MRRVWIVASLLLPPSLAGAEEEFDDHVQLGGFFGPRIFSNDALLGWNPDAPAHPDLVNSIGLGVRAARPFFFMWFLPEAELMVVPTETTTEMDVKTNVVWLEPRVQIRIDLLPKRRVEPFLIVGGGAPIALSSARKTFN